MSYNKVVRCRTTRLCDVVQQHCAISYKFVRLHTTGLCDFIQQGCATSYSYGSVRLVVVLVSQIWLFVLAVCFSFSKMWLFDSFGFDPDSGFSFETSEYSKGLE